LCPMWFLTPTQDCPFCHATAYPVAPLSSRDPSVNMVIAGCLPLLPSPTSHPPGSSQHPVLRTFRVGLSSLSLPCEPARFSASFRSPIPLAPGLWPGHCQVGCRRPKRRRLFSSCAVAGLSLDSIASTPCLVVLKHPVTVHACLLTSTWSSCPLFMVPSTPSPFHHSSDPNMATD
jgi:hypothetical protein